MSEVRITVDGQPFLGRSEEQEKFREALRTVHAERNLISKVMEWATEKKPPLPFVFLVYGEGGMGKTYLTNRLFDIAENDFQFKGHFKTLLLDWEKRRDLDYALRARDAVSAEKVFEHLYSIFRDNDFGSKFSEYERAIITRSEAEKKVSQALDKTTERGERFKTLRELGGKGIAWLLRSGIIGGVAIPVPEEPTAKFFREIIGSGAEALARARETATTLLKATLDAREFDLFTLPNEKLAHSLAVGIQNSASDKPIVLFLDTYEISDRADVWLREVIRRSSPNLIWVISGRDNLADSRKFGTRYFNGYRDDFSSDRLRVFPLSEFSADEVFTYLTAYVPERQIDADIVRGIHKATLGIPLAVEAATYMWKAETALEDIIRDVPENEKRDVIVKLMTERFLLHCFDDPAYPNDLQSIYALALAYQPDPKLLKAILQSANLEQDLSELERRHSFVFLNQMKLHSSVQAFLREYLLHPLRHDSNEVQTIHQRAFDYLQMSYSKRETLFSTLEMGIEDDLWKELKLGLIHHAFWLDSDEGWKVFVPAFVAGLMYERDFARACVDIVDSVFDMLRKPEKQRFEVIKKGLNDLADENHIITMLSRLEKLNQSQSDKLFEREVSACLLVLQGKSFNALSRYSLACEKFEEAEKSISKENKKLLDELGNSLFRLGSDVSHTNFLLKERWSQIKLVGILQKAINFMPAKHKGYAQLGYCLTKFHEYDNAINAFKEAIKLDDRFLEPYYGLALVYRNIRDVDGAIDYCYQALEIDPDFSVASNALGYLYIQREDYELAEKHLVKAAESTFFPEIFVNLGIVNLMKGQSQSAEKSFQKALEIASQDDETEIGTRGWVEVVLGRFELGLRNMKDALNRSDYIRDVQNFYDWTMIISKAPNRPNGVEYLLKFIESEPGFKGLLRF